MSGGNKAGQGQGLGLELRQRPESTLDVEVPLDCQVLEHDAGATVNKIFKECKTPEKAVLKIRKMLKDTSISTEVYDAIRWTTGWELTTNYKKCKTVL